MSTTTLVQLAYLVATGAVHLLAALDEHARDRAPRRVRRRGGHDRWPCSRPGSSPRSSTTAGSSSRSRPASSSACRSRRCRSPRCRSGPRCRTPSAGAAAGLVGTAKYYLGLGEGPETLTTFRMVAIILEIILGFLTFTGSLMAAGKLQEVKWIPQRPVTYPLQNLINLALLLVALGVGAALVLHPTAAWAPAALPRDHRPGAAVRRPADHPDRRRRHADGDRDPELVRRALRGGDGLRAGQQAADHGRRAGRLQRADPLDHHVQGDEPLVHQRAVRRLRSGAAGEGRRRAEGLQARDDRGRGAGPGAGEPGGRSSPATGWRWRRPSTRCASSTTSSRSAASR